MGGFGSGRKEGSPVDRKPTADQDGWQTINSLEMHRAGLLVPGAVFGIGDTWFFRGTFEQMMIAGLRGELRAACRVEVDTDGDTLTISHLWQSQAAPPGETVFLDYTPCGSGGLRPWLICPSCQTRRAALYFSGDAPKLKPGGHWFACRVCLGYAYESQREREAGRAAKKAAKIRRRVGGFLCGNLLETYPARRKGMHAATYARLRGQGEAAEAVVLADWRRFVEASGERVKRLSRS